MTPRRFLSGPLSAVPSAPLPTRHLLHCMRRDKQLTSHLIPLCMTLPHLMKTLVSCPPSILMTSWGEPSFFPAKRMGKQACIVEHVNHLADSPVAQEDQLCLCIKFQNQDDFEDFISYKQLMDFLEQHSEPKELTDGYFKF